MGHRQQWPNQSDALLLHSRIPLHRATPDTEVVGWEFVHTKCVCGKVILRRYWQVHWTGLIFFPFKVLNRVFTRLKSFVRNWYWSDASKRHLRYCDETWTSTGWAAVFLSHTHKLLPRSNHHHWLLKHILCFRVICWRMVANDGDLLPGNYIQTCTECPFVSCDLNIWCFWD